MPREPVAVAITTINAEHVKKHKKKRGVYVEKKSSKLSANSKASSKVYKPSKILFRSTSRNASPQKAASPHKASAVVIPKRPPANSFVNSVLNILSKTQTECPFSNPIDVNKDKPELKHLPEMTEQIDLKDLIKKNKIHNKSKKAELNPNREKSPASHSIKKKYKSKVLNSENSIRPKDVVVLQPKKRQMTQSPSVCSSSESRGGLSWMDYMEDSDDVFINNEYTAEPAIEIDYENNQVVKEINEGKKLNEEKSKHDSNEKASEKIIYNFFVDVLKKIKPDYQLQELEKPCTIKESSDELVRLEIDDDVAKKLAFSEKREIKKINVNGIDGDELSDSSAEHFEIDDIERKRPVLSEPVRRIINRKSNSFSHPKPKPIPESSSLTKRPYKSNTKAAKKKRFLALLKRQLTSNIDTEPKRVRIEQPQSFYETLRFMAKDKASPPQVVRFRESRNARRSKPKQIKKEKKFSVSNNYDVRYPIEAEVDSRYVSNVYASPDGSFSSLQVYGEDYIFKGDTEYDNISENTDLCNRFSITSFGWQSSKNIRTRSSPLSIAHKNVGHRSTSPFSGRSGRF